MAGLCFCFFALVLFFPFPSDQIGGGFLVCYFFSSLSLLLFVFFGCSDGMEREACVCDHGYERSDLCAEIIIIIITTIDYTVYTTTSVQLTCTIVGVGKRGAY